MPSRSEFDFSFGPRSHSGHAPRPVDPGAPFRILIIGDFSGRASRGILDADLAARPLLRADIDTLDGLFPALGAAVRVPTSAAGAPLDAPLTRFDDLHPDALLRGLPELDTLLSLRRRLADPATAASAAPEARTLLGLPPAEGNITPAPPAAAAAAPAPAPAAQPSLLESLLGGKPAAGQPATQAAPATPPTNPVADIVRRLAAAASQTTPAAAADPHAAMLLGALDDLLASHLRTILHNPAFQRTEASWRALHFLITSIETDETLTVDILDASKAELVADMLAAHRAGAPAASSLARVIADRASVPGADPWSLVVADLTLDFTTPDAALAAHLASVAARAGCALVAAASPAIAGCASFAIAPDPDSWAPHPSPDDPAAPAAWAAVRQAPEARHLCLTLPRFLLRPPYDPSANPCESFPFREVASPADHESLLWGNAAYAAAVLIASAYAEDGADMLCPEAGDLTGLPVHTFMVNGQPHPVPPAEAWLTLKAAHTLQNAGLTPLLSIKNRDAARFPTIQSFTTPPTPLAGRWPTTTE